MDMPLASSTAERGRNSEVQGDRAAAGRKSTRGIVGLRPKTLLLLCLLVLLGLTGSASSQPLAPPTATVALGPAYAGNFLRGSAATVTYTPTLAYGGAYEVLAWQRRVLWPDCAEYPSDKYEAIVGRAEHASMCKHLLGACIQIYRNDFYLLVRQVKNPVIMEGQRSTGKGWGFGRERI